MTPLGVGDRDIFVDGGISAGCSGALLCPLIGVAMTNVTPRSSWLCDFCSVDINLVLLPSTFLTGFSLNTLDILTSLFKTRLFVTAPAPALPARRVSASWASETDKERDLERGNELLALCSVAWLWVVDAVGNTGDAYRLLLEAADNFGCFWGTLDLGTWLLSTSIGELDRERGSEDGSSENGELGNILVRNRAHSSGSFDLNL